MEDRADLRGPDLANAGSGVRTATEVQSSGPVSIEIAGIPLSIRSDKDPEQVHALAAYLNDKVATIQALAPSAPFEKLLMLASLTVVEELFDTQHELGDLRTVVEATVGHCLDLCDDVEQDL
jgi:cell division protein ZapA (FtsZ GTPase activity inhibitor)